MAKKFNEAELWPGGRSPRSFAFALLEAWPDKKKIKAINSEIPKELRAAVKMYTSDDVLLKKYRRLKNA